MKLKLVVASMSVLGLISCPAFAATQTKHTHHKMVKHHMVETHDYKAMGSLPMVPVMQMCQSDMFQQTLDFADQNVGRAKATVDCNKPLTLAGGINFDSNWGNRHMGYQGEDNKRLDLNDAYINISGTANEWTKAFVGLSYNTNNSEVPGYAANEKVTANHTPKPGTFSDAYAAANTFDVEQGFITVGKFDFLPIYLQLGKQYTDFGRYQIHPQTESLDQVFSESSHVTAKLGFVTQMGLSGSVYAFNNDVRLTSDSHKKANYGAALGYVQPGDSLGFDAGVGYMYDFTGVNAVADVVTDFNGSGDATGGTSTYTETSRVGAAALYGDVNSGPFSIGLRYTAALQRFSASDLTSTVGSGAGAKPWAAGVNADYAFNAWGRNQNVYVGFQATNDAVTMALPRNRWQAGYDVALYQNTKLGVQLNHDIDYSVASGGTGQASNTVNLRLGVMFG